MAFDETEDYRRARQAELNAAAEARAELEAKHGQVWDRDQVEAEFEVLGFMAPFMVVRRKADGTKGSLEFQHAPRFYFNYVEDR